MVVYTNFTTVLKVLLEIQNLWNNFDINSYVYSSRMDCFCLACSRAPMLRLILLYLIYTPYIITYIYDICRFIGVLNDTVNHVTFDQVGIEKLNLQTNCNDSINLYVPFSENYKTIDYRINEAIIFAENGIQGSMNCDGNNQNEYCGGSIELEYDTAFYYPTFLSLKLSPLIADGDKTFYFDCLTPYQPGIDTSNYNRACNVTSGIIFNYDIQYNIWK